MTIHSWSGIGIRNFLDEKGLSELEDKKYLWKRFEKARVLIIDEVSMLHGSQLEMIEKVCRRFNASFALGHQPPVSNSIRTRDAILS